VVGARQGIVVGFAAGVGPDPSRRNINRFYPAIAAVGDVGPASVRTLLLVVVRGYRWLVLPLLPALFGPGPHCRFEPTCSAYAEEALVKHGVCRGVLLTLKRLTKCHPWGGCGCDPVPPRSENPDRRGLIRAT